MGGEPPAAPPKGALPCHRVTKKMQAAGCMHACRQAGMQAGTQPACMQARQMGNTCGESWGFQAARRCSQADPGMHATALGDPKNGTKQADGMRHRGMRDAEAGSRPHGSGAIHFYSPNSWTSR